jgi:hypothetical protein
MFNIRTVRCAVITVERTTVAHIVRFIVISGTSANGNGIARLMGGIKESFWLATETSNIVVVDVVFIIETIGTVFRTIITPVVSAVIISAIVTH